MKYILVIAIATILFFALMPGRMTPAFIVDHDKVVHAVVFFMLALMLRRSFPGVSLLQCVVFLGIFGVGIETLQYLFANRGFSRGDIVFDGLGLTLYAAGAIVVRSVRKRLQNQSDRPDKRV